MKRHSGFTLAEVLITLAIIGTVAAMTIPTLMTNTNKMEFKTGFKKILSTTNQAVTMSVALNYIDFSDTTTTQTNPTTSILGILINRMHVTKTADNTTNDNTSVARMFGATAANNYTVFFADGMVLSFPKGSMNCTLPQGGGRGSICRGIVDVNGTRPPNYLSNCQGTQKKNIVTDSATGCSPITAGVFDQFSVLMADQQVQPNGQAAKYVLFEN